MARHQRYVSDELTHFVGRGLPTEEAQYQLLISILGSGLLKSAGCDITVEQGPRGPETKVRYSLTVQSEKALSSNEKYRPSIVCFADIPVEDLQLHVRKYSAFGLSFQKSFLLQHGANPVFYVAASSPTLVRNPLANNPSNSAELMKAHRARGGLGSWENFSRAELLDAAERAQQSVLSTYAQVGATPTLGPDPFSPQGVLRDALAWYLFPFLKFFDPQLPDHDVDNYYMEREWRVVGPVKFAIGDVERVLVPRAFARRLRDDAPEYCGQVTFL